jgi:hypothetical protein
MTSVTAVSSMHEEVHEGANQKRYVDESTQDVCPVLGKEQHAGDRQKADQDEARRRGKKTASRLIAVARVVMLRHGFLLFDDETSAELALLILAG